MLPHVLSDNDYLARFYLLKSLKHLRHQGLQHRISTPLSLEHDDSDAEGFKILLVLKILIYRHQNVILTSSVLQQPTIL